MLTKKIATTISTYGCVIENDITTHHVAMENVLLQMLNQSTLQPKVVYKTGDPLPHAILTPAECTMHLGMPVVPEEYMMKRGWSNGTCSYFKTEPTCSFTKSSNITLQAKIESRFNH